MRLNTRTVAIVAGISAVTTGLIIYAVNHDIGGLDRLLGKSGWF